MRNLNINKMKMSGEYIKFIYFDQEQIYKNEGVQKLFLYYEQDCEVDINHLASANKKAYLFENLKILKVSCANWAKPPCNFEIFCNYAKLNELHDLTNNCQIVDSILKLKANIALKNFAFYNNQYLKIIPQGIYSGTSPS